MVAEQAGKAASGRTDRCTGQRRAGDGGAGDRARRNQRADARNGQRGDAEQGAGTGAKRGLADDVGDGFAGTVGLGRLAACTGDDARWRCR